MAMSSTDAFPAHFLPGIRFGTYQGPYLPAGYVYSGPLPTTCSDRWCGSWLQPDARHCNPLGWHWMSKLSFTSPCTDKKLGVLLIKSTVCLKANCTGQGSDCSRVKCYDSTYGKCLRFTSDIFPWNQEYVDRSHSVAASTAFMAGSYSNCTEDDEAITAPLIAGN